MATQGIVLTLFGRSDVGKDRAKDEDTFLVSDLNEAVPVRATASAMSYQVSGRGVLMVVSDGMGGGKAGGVASSLVVDALRRGMSTAQAISAEVALRLCVEDVNRQVFAAAQKNDLAGMGATLTAILFHCGNAYVAEIGDSRAYLLRGRRLTELTHDQSYVQRLIDAGVLTKEQAKVSEYKSAILQAIGLNPRIVVVMGRVSLRRKDRFLVCSDGLSGVLDNQMMLNIILGSPDLETACAKLIHTAVDHGSKDDITVVLAEVDGEGAPMISDTERLALETTKVFHPA